MISAFGLVLFLAGCAGVILSYGVLKALWWLDRCSTVAMVIGAAMVGAGSWAVMIGALMAIT